MILWCYSGRFGVLFGTIWGVILTPKPPLEESGAELVQNRSGKHQKVSAEHPTKTRECRRRITAESRSAPRYIPGNPLEKKDGGVRGGSAPPRYHPGNLLKEKKAQDGV